MDERLPIDAFLLYASSYCEIPFVILDGENRICRHNTAFEKRIVSKKVETGSEIGRYCQISYGEENLIAYHSEYDISVYLFDFIRTGVLSARVPDYGHILVQKDQKVLFFDILKSEEIQIIERISNVNNGLSEMARVYSKQTHALEKDVFIDPLTQVHNRRALTVNVSAEIAEAEKQQLAVAAMMIDIDDFKAVNDVYGHDAGDEVLKSCAQMLRSQTRSGDLVYRYGGEEFLVIAFCDGKDAALVIAEKLVSAVSGIDHRIERKVTISMGLTLHESGEPVDEMIKRADVHLYEAKRKGKDRVEHNL